MIDYYYGVTDQEGKRRTGVIRADDRGQALTALRQRYPVVMRLDEVEKAGLWKRLLGEGRVSEEDLLAVTHQLSCTLESGLSFGSAMEILLMDRVHRPPVRRMLVAIAAAVNEGRPLSRALEEHPRIFSPLYVQLVRAGEASAQLPEVLRSLAAHIERNQRVRSELMGAALYPLLVLVVGLLMVTATVVTGGPLLKEMYSQAGAQLPWYSLFFITVGARLASLGGWLPVLLLATVVGALKACQSEQAQTRIYQLLFRFGPLREVLIEAAVARSCRALGLLYSNGIPIMEALKLSATATGSPAIERVFKKVRTEVAAGRPLAEPFLKSELFPQMAAGMIAAGEKSGDLPRMLRQISDYYERRLDLTLRNFAKMAEPALILFVGLLVGLVIAALGMPFLNLVTVI